VIPNSLKSSTIILKNSKFVQGQQKENQNKGLEIDVGFYN
jgi:selenocysteine-specific translation elongation factor